MLCVLTYFYIKIDIFDLLYDSIINARMTEHTYSEVLFYGDDGLPLHFNIQYTVEKECLKDIIEAGGGMCTLSDEAIHLVSPGTKVLNVDPSKTLISSRYIFDCIKEDNLLDTDEYRIEIHAVETSDFSDNSANLLENQDNKDNGRKSSDDIIDNSVDIIGPNRELSPNLLNCLSSNHAFDFEDSEIGKNAVVCHKESEPKHNKLFIPLQASETHIKFNAFVKEKEAPEACVNAVPDSLEELEKSVNIGQNLSVPEMHEAGAIASVSYGKNDVAVSNLRDSPVNAVVVSSSQPNEDGLDQFDNMVLNKVQEKVVQADDDSLSQSYTVSSSADAQVSPKAPSHNTSAEIFGGSSAAPDSASQTTERQKYIKHLEKEIEEILKKPSPKSIQDKITFVKYICVVKKLAPAIVLQTLQNF